VLDDSTFRRILTVVREIYSIIPDECIKIVIPPIPRYLFAGCCQDPGHCTNRADTGFQKKIIGKLEHLRQILKSELNQWGVRNSWLVDSVRSLAGLCPGTGSVLELLAGLRTTSAPDGVHLTNTGNRRFLMAILDSEKNLNVLEPRAGDCTVKKSGFYWRGFTSPVGSGERQGGTSGNYGLERQRHPRGRYGKNRSLGGNPYKREVVGGRGGY